MKKLLSICFLSMLLALAGLTANAQCCFWLENLQPDTVRDVSNLGLPSGSTAALLPGHGGTLVLSNNLSPVYNTPYSDHLIEGLNINLPDRVDWYKFHIGYDCGSANTKVSLEWKLYHDGQLLSDANIDDYADIYMFTKFDQLANTNIVGATCGHMGWLGGKLNGPGVCFVQQNNCGGGYPGSIPQRGSATQQDYIDQHIYRDGFGDSDGYMKIAHAYNLDYLYLGFLQSTETRLAINWKRAGNYALVVSLRERTDGTDFSIWQDDDQNSFIGGHQSHCGNILAKDSLTYPVYGSHVYSICQGENFYYEFGNPAAIYTQEGTYLVLNAYNTASDCGNLKVKGFDTLHLYTRISPAIVASNKTVCRGENLSAEEFSALAPAVSTDAPGYVGHEVLWLNGSEWTVDLPTYSTDAIGVYKFPVKQRNHYDSQSERDFWCEGPIDTVVLTVLDIIPPVLISEDFNFCFSELPTTAELIARLDNTPENQYANDIHWFLGTTHSGTPVHTDALVDDISTYNASVDCTNKDSVIVYTAFSYASLVNAYSATGVSVTINVWKNPVLTAQEDVQIDTCPHTQGIELNSEFTCSNFEASEQLTWTYTWKKNGSVLTDVNGSTYTVVVPGCGETDVYEVTGFAISEYGCSEEISRTFEVSGNDVEALTIDWKDDSFATRQFNGCDTTNLFGTIWPAPYTMADVFEETLTKASASAIEVKADYCNNRTNLLYTVDVDATAVPCTTIVTRNYKLVDECGNESNTISQVYTIVNNVVPTISGDPIELQPVRPLQNDCKSNLPSREVLLAAFDSNFTVATGCNAQILDENIQFFLGNTEVIADGNLDIFANDVQVDVYVQVSDECNNVSEIFHAFYLNKPADIDISHGAIVVSNDEVCNLDTVGVFFDSTLVHNGASPYTITWSQTPIPAGCGIDVLSDNVHIRTWALNQTYNFNTIAQFIVTVADKYGCVATDTSNSVQWFARPEVTIVENSINAGYPHTNPVIVCPNYGPYHIEANGLSNLPVSKDQTLTYHWSGEYVDALSLTKNSSIFVNDSICDREYVANVEVANSIGCITKASYSIQSGDIEAPVLTLNMPYDTVTVMEDCKIIIPDYTLLYTNDVVSDNCWSIDDMTITQSVAPGTKVDVDTEVIVTVTPKCGPAVMDTIKACFPKDLISIDMLSSLDSACNPYTTTFSVNTLHAAMPVKVYWDGSTTPSETLTFTTTSETEGLHHTVRVVDANGCSVEDEYTLTVYHTPTEDDVISHSTPNHYCDFSDSNLFDGTIQVNAVNPEVDSIRYAGTTEWKALPFTDTVSHGEYVFDLHTIHGCVGSAVVKVIVERDTTDSNLTLQLGLITDNANCVKPWTGHVDVLNPVTGYTYHISAGAEDSGDETIVWDPSIYNRLRFEHLYQDTYTVSVLSTFNCHGKEVVEIADHREFPEIPEFEVVSNKNCVSPNGQIILTNTNTDWNYTINGDTVRGNGAALTLGNTFAAGTHRLYISALYTGCVDSVDIVVPDESDDVAMPDVTISNNTYCVGANGSLSLVPVEGMQYSLRSGTDTITLAAGETSFTGLEAGTYVIVVRDLTTGCENSGDYTIENDYSYDMPDYIVSPRTNCDDALANGSISAPDANYTYEIKDNSGEVVTDYNALLDGEYLIEATDIVTGCTAEANFTVEFVKPSFDWQITTTPDVDCSEIGTGSIVATSTEPATFTAEMNSDLGWVNVEDMNALEPGSYRVTALVTATGCSYTKDTTIVTDYTYPVISADASANYNCTDVRNGKITFEDVASEKNYTSVIFKVNLEEATSPILNANSGIYTISAISDLHCAALEDVEVTVKDSAFVVIDNYSTTPDAFCTTGIGNGTLTVVAHSANASGVLAYSIDGTSYQLNNVFTNLEDGTYSIFVKDTTTGCEVDTTTSVETTEYEIDVIIDTEPNTACVDSLYNGKVHVEAFYANDSLGTGDFTYEISGGNLEGLGEGLYYITVIDNVTGCKLNSLTAGVESFVQDIEIEFNNVPNNACVDSLYNGKVFVSASYVDTTLGAGTFSYGISGDHFEGLADGTYSVTVTDVATGCVVDTTIKVAKVDLEVDIVFNNVPNTACDSSLYNGEVHVSASYQDANLGTGNFTYEISGGSYTNLGGGFYTVTVTDVATGCEYVATTEVENKSTYTPSIIIVPFNPNSNPDTNAVHYCFNQENGYLKASATSTLEGDNNFIYRWNSECNHIHPVNDSTDVYTGENMCCDYTVTVTSVLTGCVNHKTIRVCVDGLPSIDFVFTRDGSVVTPDIVTPTETYSNCENKEFTLCVVDHGFTSIEWTNGHTGNTPCFTVPAFTLTPGMTSYCVKVEDANGCSAGPKAVNVITNPIATDSVTIVECGSYTYVGSRTITFTYDALGLNTHTVKDTFNAANGCDSVVTYTIIIKALPTFEITAEMQTSLDSTHCHGETLLTSGNGLIVTNAPIYGWRIYSLINESELNRSNVHSFGEEFNPNNPLDWNTMNGKRVVAYAINECDTIIGDKFTLKINHKPFISDEDYKSLEDNTICLGEPATFDDSSKDHVNWAGDEGNVYVEFSLDGGATWTNYPATNAVYPQLTDDFKVRVRAINMCGDSIIDGPITITVKDTTKLTVIGDTTQYVCLGTAIDTISFTVVNATATVTGLPSGITFDATTNTISGTAQSAGTFNYTITAVPTEGHCDGKVEKEITGQITVFDTVSLSLTNISQTICLGDSIDPVVVSYVNATISYGTCPGISYNTSTNTFSGAPQTAGLIKIYVDALNSNDCSPMSDTIRIMVNDTVKLIAPTTGLEQIVCEGTAINPIQLGIANAEYTVEGLPAGVTSSLAEGTITIAGTPTESGKFIYTVTALSSMDCGVKTFTDTIVVDAPVTLTLTPSENQNICLGEPYETVKINASEGAIVTFDPTFVSSLTERGLNFSVDSVYGTPITPSIEPYRWIVYASSTLGVCPVVKDSTEFNVYDSLAPSARNLEQTRCLGDEILEILLVNNATYPEYLESINVTGLPAGVTYHQTSTGDHYISGAPTVAGTFDYTVEFVHTQGCGNKILTGTLVVNDTVKVSVDESKLEQIVCKGSAIEDIVFNVENATLEIVGELPAGIVLNGTTISGTPTTKDLLGTSVIVRANSLTTPSCGYKDFTVKFTVNDAPEILFTLAPSIACDGSSLEEPLMIGTGVNENGSALISSGFYFENAPITFPVTADMSMNGKTIQYIATNACGSDAVETSITINAVPVPVVSKDTVICDNGTATLHATPGYISYQWSMDGTEIDGATSADYTYVATDNDPHHFTVEVVDENGCVSNKTVNGTIDLRYFSEENSVTIIANSNPGFIFKHNGNTTHHVDANTADAHTVYTWEVTNDCAYENILVFVAFDIYYNGQLIDDDSIGRYIMTEHHGISNPYVSTDEISWYASPSAGSLMSAMCYYNAARSSSYTTANSGLNIGNYNHFPVGQFAPMGSQKMDDLYLDFLTNRPVTKTLNQFRKAGEYKIEYRLIGTSTGHPMEHLYYHNGAYGHIGGVNSVIYGSVFDTIAYDVITFSVIGDDVLDNAPDMSPAPAQADNFAAASMEVYPNPAQNGKMVNARINGLNGKTVVKIVNISGKVIAQESLDIFNDEYIYTCELSNLAPGVYFIYVEGENAILSKKLVITK